MRQPLRLGRATHAASVGERETLPLSLASFLGARSRRYELPLFSQSILGGGIATTDAIACLKPRGSEITALKISRAPQTSRSKSNKKGEALHEIDSGIAKMLFCISQLRCKASLINSPLQEKPLRCLTACFRLALDEAARPRSSRYANSGSQRAHARRRGAHPTRQSNAAMSAATRLDLLPSAAKGRPCGGSFPAGETCAENPRRAHGGQRGKWLRMGDRQAQGAPWPRTSDGHHLLPTGAVQRRPAAIKCLRC